MIRTPGIALLLGIALTGCKTPEPAQQAYSRFERTALADGRVRIRHLVTSADLPPALDSGLLREARDACSDQRFEVDYLLENQDVSAIGHFHFPQPSIYASEVVIRCLPN